MLVSHKRLLVEWGDCDPAGIVFYPRYLAWFDDCTTALFLAAGLPFAVAEAELGRRRDGAEEGRAPLVAQRVQGPCYVFGARSAAEQQPVRRSNQRPVRGLTPV